MTGHHRLLDNKDVRRAWGTHDQCTTALQDFAAKEAWPKPKPKVVITLHGLIRSREAMEGIAEYLQKEGDYEVVNVTYASTRRSIDQHAESLAKVIAGLEGVEEINFVCHSLGNIVVRRYLGEAAASEPKWVPDTRVKRFVMLGPPNNGAELAKTFIGNKLVAMVLGPSTKQLGGEWDTVSTRIGVPKCEFGIIAGANGTDAGATPLIKGDDDFVVSVAETRLAGACDFRTVNLLHGQLMNNGQVRSYVLKFLRDGCFESADSKQPIR
jgi:pimeloyl-ACP methyl ester carboxylesterase